MADIQIYPRREFLEQTDEERSALIAEIEGLTGPIPEPYRSFLSTYAGGFPWPNDFPVSEPAVVEVLGDGGFAVEEFYDAEYVLQQAKGETYGSGTPKGYVFVADAQGGWNVLLKTEQPDRGALFLWPHTTRPWGERSGPDDPWANDDGRLDRIADGFEAFLDQLYEDPISEVGRDNWEHGKRNSVVHVIRL